MDRNDHDELLWFSATRNQAMEDVDEEERQAYFNDFLVYLIVEHWRWTFDEVFEYYTTRYPEPAERQEALLAQLWEESQGMYDDVSLEEAKQEEEEAAAAPLYE